jgi:hypothetical protein
MNRWKLAVVLCFSAVALMAQSAGIPAGAVKVGDTYRYTDAQGRKWIYRQTPFGLSRVSAEEAAAVGKTPDVTARFMRATDHGDTVSFERPSPFGTYRWEVKKSQMDASERAAYERIASKQGLAAETDRK